MTQKVAVIGASGVYGRHLVPRLRAREYEVRALMRRPPEKAALAACGAEMRIADIFDCALLSRALEGCDAAINIATAVPRPGVAGDFAMNNRIRREGTPTFVRACRDAGVRRIVQQSIAMIHGNRGDEWIDETTPIDEGGPGAAVRAMEGSIEQSDLDWTILRGGLFYGPGTGQEDNWFTQSLAGTLRMPGEGDAFVSLIHVADMAAATAAALEQASWQQVYLVVDDGPARWRQVLAHAAAVVGREAPREGGPSTLPSFRASNRRIRDSLAWAPRYPDFRSGLVC